MKYPNWCTPNISLLYDINELVSLLNKSPQERYPALMRIYEKVTWITASLDRTIEFRTATSDACGITHYSRDAYWPK